MGKKGDDLICGGLGDDKINGGKGLNTLVGGIGNDNIISKSSLDVIFGNQGENEIHDETGDARIVAGSHKEIAYKNKSKIGKKTKLLKIRDVAITNVDTDKNNKRAKQKEIVG